MEEKQIALVLTFNSSVITKEEAIKRLNNIKCKLEEIIEKEFIMNLVNSDVYPETIYIDDLYDNWENE